MDGQQPQMSVNEQEIELIKKTFADNEPLLKLMRALFFGLEVSKAEKDTILSTFASDELRAIMWKRFLPSLSKDLPIGQAADVWLGVEGMVFGAHRDQIEQAVEYKELSIKMTQQALELLENPDAHVMDVSYGTKKHPGDALQVNLLARNQYIRHIESQLMFLFIIAGQKTETVADAKKRLQQSSSK